MNITMRIFEIILLVLAINDIILINKIIHHVTEDNR